MNWNFDSIFFSGFAILCFYLAIKNSKWLFWGSSQFKAGEESLGKNYKRIINLAGGVISGAFGIYVLLK